MMAEKENFSVIKEKLTNNMDDVMTEISKMIKQVEEEIYAVDGMLNGTESGRRVNENYLAIRQNLSNSLGVLYRCRDRLETI